MANLSGYESSISQAADTGNRPTTVQAPSSPVKGFSEPSVKQSDDLESCIREAYNAAVLLGRRTVEEAHRCGYLLTEARRTADRRDGGLRGVLARADIPLRTAYRLIELYERYPKCADLAHFTSVDRALAKPKPAEYRPTGPAFDSEAAWDRIPAVLEEGVELEAACRLALLTQHATQTGALPADPDRWLDYNPCDHCDCAGRSFDPCPLGKPFAVEAK